MSGARIGNPSGDVWWWEGDEGPAMVPMPGSNLPCGCFIRRPDFEAVLCPTHLAELNAAPVPHPAATDPSDGGGGRD